MMGLELNIKNRSVMNGDEYYYILDVLVIFGNKDIV